VEKQWRDLKQTATTEHRTVFEVSALMALSAVRALPAMPRKAMWFSQCAGDAARKTGELMVDVLLDHYRASLEEIRREGYFAYWRREFRPYLAAAARQFSPARVSLTERLLRR
jgi:hypothetical protein